VPGIFHEVVNPSSATLVELQLQSGVVFMSYRRSRSRPDVPDPIDVRQESAVTQKTAWLK
jgi:hypothetical protein